VYAQYYPWAVPANASSGTSIIQCSLFANSQFCPGPPTYCEPVQFGMVGCVLAYSVPAPPPPPPPSPLPPAPPPVQCTHAYNFSTPTWITGIYVQPGYGPAPCSTGNHCRNGALSCVDQSVYAMYNPFTPPANATSGNTLIQCLLGPTNPAYCPASNDTIISYCEPASALSCIIVSYSPYPPPSPAPPLPVSPGPQCTTATNITGAPAKYVSGLYCAQGQCGTACPSTKCRFGGLLCADGSAFAFYFNVNVSSAQSLQSLVSCYAATAPAYCPGGSSGYCEFASAPAPLCVITGANPAPSSPPPAPPLPPAVNTLCASAGNTSGYAPISGVYCTNTTCPIAACAGKCNYGGLICTVRDHHSSARSLDVSASLTPPSAALSRTALCMRSTTRGPSLRTHHQAPASSSAACSLIPSTAPDVRHFASPCRAAWLVASSPTPCLPRRQQHRRRPTHRPCCAHMQAHSLDPPGSAACTLLRALGQLRVHLVINVNTAPLHALTDPYTQCSRGGPRPLTRCQARR
jgi:hypothetical protein